MQQGRKKNLQSKMKGCINDEHKLTDIYLPRKCDYTDRVITSGDRSSIQLSICNVNEDGTINPKESSLVTICGFVRATGLGDSALEQVLKEKKLI